MTEEATVKEVSIDTADMVDFRKARSEGKLTITEKPPEKAEETKETAEETDKPKLKGGFQKRIDRLVKHTASLEEELAATKRELAAKAAPTNGAEKKTDDSGPVQVPGEPQREQFKTEGEYIRAMVKFERAQEDEADRRETQIAADKEAAKAYNAKAIEAQARHEDWDEVMKQETPIPSIVGDAIVHTLPNGAEVAYHLGKHPEICEQMMKAHPLEAVAMAVKISEQLAKENKGEDDEEEKKEEEEVPEKQETKPAKPVSKAPAPIKPVSGGTTKSSVPLDSMDMREYNKARKAGRVQ